MIDLTSKKMLSDRLNPIIDAALQRKNEAREPRTYLGGSRIGSECERALQYEFFNTPKDAGKEFSGQILRVFQRGHWVEEAMIGWMRDAGIEILTEDEQGQQFGYERHNGLEKGHCDGVIVGGPDQFGSFPRLWENKGLGEKYFNEVVKHGLKKSKPVYWAQCQIYMERFGLTDHPALFSAVNMNDMAIHWEEVPYNAQALAMLDAKSERIIQACIHGELLPRQFNDPSYYLCKWCSWGERCYRQ